jgi:hypothetical protein
MLQSCQPTTPWNSAKIDQFRFRRAIARPWEDHWAVSSGFQWSIQRPGRVARAGAVDSGAAWGGAPCGGAVLRVSVIGASGGVGHVVELVQPTLWAACFLGSVRW